MSDFKDRFRAAAAQRSSNVPSKEQIRALKAQKNAAREPVNSVPLAAAHLPSSSAAKTQAQAPSQPGTSRALPDDFFQPHAKAHEATVGSSAPTSAPSAAALARSAGISGAKVSALPQGFFSDKAADAKARGEKLPDEKDKEEEFKQFQRMMDDQIKDIASKEAEEAEEDAEYRADREAFEQSARLKQLEGLRRRKLGEGAPEGSAADGRADPDAKLLLPARKRRVMDVLQEQLADSDGEGSGDDVGSDLVLDWRAKGV